SPAVETTVAVVFAVYVLAMPGVKAPKVAGAPSVSASVAATLPPTGLVVLVWPRICEPTADVLPLKSTPIHLTVVPGARSSASGSSRGRFGFHSLEAVVGVEPSVV